MKLLPSLSFILVTFRKSEAFVHFPRGSSFIGDAARIQHARQRVSPRNNCWREMRMYESNFERPRKSHAQEKLKSGFWVALDHTEKWISQILSSSTKENPYARKEVFYDCELNQKTLGAIAGIFRRFKEARQLAERHERYEKESLMKDSYYEPNSLKRTQVNILPFCEYFDKFEDFEGVIQAIHQARRNARDLVTDLAIEKRQHQVAGVAKDRDWSIAINGASMHPEYSTPKNLLDTMENQGQMDKKKRKLIERKDQCRQAPYPTLIIEVKAEPQSDSDVIENGSVANVEYFGIKGAFMERLESIYAMSAAMYRNEKDNEEDVFYNAIGLVSGIEEISPANALENAQDWIMENDRKYDAHLSSFTSSNLKHVDSAYEFVFLNLSLHDYSPRDDASKNIKATYTAGARSYLVLPKFVSSSATSFDKFANDVKSILNTIDGLADRISLETLHPEHVHSGKRCPSPVLVLQWYNED